MTSTTIYSSSIPRPYVYKIIHTETGQFYIGSRYSTKIKLPSSLDILQYKTSSPVVKSMGFENFETSIIAEFIGDWEPASKAAYSHEQQLIKECWGNPLLLNRRYYDGLNTYTNNSGRATVTDGNRSFHISVDDPRYLSGEVTNINKGLVLVYDDEGNKIKISQEEYNRGHHTHVNEGVLTAVNKSTGEKTRISTEEYATNRDLYEGAGTTGQVTVKDSTGKTFNVSVNDPAYLSGILIPHLRGNIIPDERKRKISEALLRVPKIFCETCRVDVSQIAWTRHVRSLNHLRLLNLENT